MRRDLPQRFPRSAATYTPHTGWTPAWVAMAPGRYRRSNPLAFMRASLAMYLDAKPDKITRRCNIEFQRDLRKATRWPTIH